MIPGQCEVCGGWIQNVTAACNSSSALIGKICTCLAPVPHVNPLTEQQIRAIIREEIATYLQNRKDK